MYWFPNRPILMTKDILSGEKSPVQGVDWSAEIKFKGDRLVLQYDGKHFRFMNRQKQELKYRPPESMLDELHDMRLKGPCQLDGELMHNKAKVTKNFIYFYDIYVHNGEQVRDMLKDRRKRLFDLINMVGLPKHLTTSAVYRSGDNGNIRDIFAGAPGAGYRMLFDKVIQNPEFEGLVFKNDNGSLVFDPVKSPDVWWQIKVRRPEKNHKIFER